LPRGGQYSAADDILLAADMLCEDAARSTARFGSGWIVCHGWVCG
jgi:hypothetical protein